MQSRAGRPRKKDDQSQYAIRAVDRAVAVMNSFSVEAPELSLRDIAERTELSKPTVFRLLATLEAHRYVSFDSGSGRYRLGSKVLELGGIAFSSLTLRRVARPHLDQLQTATESTVLLGTLMDDQLVFVDKRDAAGPVRVVAEIGLRKSPHFGMLGMVLMAFADVGELARLLERYPLAAHTPFSITDQGRFLGRLDEIRSQGYVVEFNEAIVGFGGVAAPIRGYDGSVVAAVGAVVALSERAYEKADRVLAAVTACARGISLGMGYREPSSIGTAPTFPLAQRRI